MNQTIAVEGKLLGRLCNVFVQIVPKQKKRKKISKKKKKKTKKKVSQRDEESVLDKKCLTVCQTTKQKPQNRAPVKKTRTHRWHKTNKKRKKKKKKKLKKSTPSKNRTKLTSSLHFSRTATVTGNKIEGIKKRKKLFFLTRFCLGKCGV